MSRTEEWMATYHEHIRRYSLSVTGGGDDAEDVYQETALRLLRALKQDSSRAVTRAFIYRITKNVWIDMCRKRKLKEVSLHILPEHQLQRAQMADGMELLETLELLASRLSPRYLVVLLLMDVFHFTAKETAGLIGGTEGAVHITRSRARHKIQMLQARSCQGNLDVAPISKATLLERDAFQSIVEGFRRRDAQQIVNAFLQISSQDSFLRQMRVGAYRLSFAFEDPDGNVCMVSSR